MTKILDMLNKITYLIKIIMLIVIAHFLILHREKNASFLILGLLIIVFLGAYEYCDKKINRINLFTKTLIISFAIILSVVLLLLDKFDDVILIYYFFLLDDIFEIQNHKYKDVLLWFHFIGFLAFCISDEDSLSFDSATNILTATIIYGFIFLIYFIIHRYKIERDKYRGMYQDLLEFSFQQRDLLISNERTKISQELHDSLGHLLMAATMNLRFIKKVNGSYNSDINEGLQEIENILLSCTTELRNCVKNVRELEEDIKLDEELLGISMHLKRLNMVNIIYMCKFDTNQLNVRVRNIIYRITRESITNSIIHGKAEVIKIFLQADDERVKLEIADNGVGCAEIMKSYGLNSMVENVKQLAGVIYFKSEKNKGFQIVVSISKEMAYD